MSASVDADVTLEPFSGSVAVNPVNITGGMTIDAGLDDIVIQGNPAQPIAVLAGGVPGNPLVADVGLDKINVTLQPLTIEPLTLNPVTVTLTPLSIDLKLEPMQIDLGLDNMNLAMGLAITEFPRMKVHSPIKMDFGVGLFGVPIMNFSVCGEAGFISEDNPPSVCAPIVSKPAASKPPASKSVSQPASLPPFRVVLND